MLLKPTQSSDLNFFHTISAINCNFCCLQHFTLKVTLILTIDYSKYSAEKQTEIEQKGVLIIAFKHLKKKETGNLHFEF